MVQVQPAPVRHKDPHFFDLVRAYQRHSPRGFIVMPGFTLSAKARKIHMQGIYWVQTLYLEAGVETYSEKPYALHVRD